MNDLYCDTVIKQKRIEIPYIHPGVLEEDRRRREERDRAWQQPELPYYPPRPVERNPQQRGPMIITPDGETRYL